MSILSCLKFSNRFGILLLSVVLLNGLTALPSFADPGNNWSFGDITSGQIFKHSAIGAAVGAGTGVLSDRTSVGRGAVIGGVTGAGSGIVGKMDYLRDKPLMRNAAQGAVIGTGAGYALRSSKVKGAIIGAGAGAGVHYVRKHMNDRYRY